MAAATETMTSRASTETDHRHLLARSTCQSEASSLIDAETLVGDRTPRARSLVSASNETLAQPQDTATSQSYKGFPSKAHYLAALNAWAESKRYIEPSDSTLEGYYGETTMNELAERPRVSFGITSWKQQRKEKKDAKRRSVA